MYTILDVLRQVKHIKAFIETGEAHRKESIDMWDKARKRRISGKMFDVSTEEALDTFLVSAGLSGYRPKRLRHNLEPPSHAPRH